MLYAKQVANVWKPLPKKSFAELRDMNTIQKKDYIDQLFAKDAQVSYYIENTAEKIDETED